MKQALGLVASILLLGGAVGARAQSSFFFLSPQEISFGTVTVGQTATSTARAYRSADDGTVVTATSNNLVFSVTPMSQVVGTDGDTFTVRFQPLTGGPQSGIITFTEGGSQPRVVGELPVSGIGFAPFTVNPGSLTFEQTLVGSSVSKTFRIIAGQQSEALELSVQSSNPTVFSAIPEGISGLAAGASRIVTVTFSPDTAGVLRGAIRITGGGAVVSVEVEGEGAAFVLSAAQLDLGGALVGCSTSRAFTVTTGGLFDFQIVPTTSGLPFSAEPSTFSASAPTEVMALFAPVAAGPAQGALRVLARLGSRIVQQQDLAVAGIGTEPVANPSSIDFGETPVGVAASGSFVITPNPPAAFQGIYSASSDNPAFRVVSTNTSGRVNIDFSPVAEGPASGIITVEVATQSDRECVVTVQAPVEGIGGQALLTLTPETIDFGMQPVGQASSPREVVVSNQSNRTFSGMVTSNSAAFRVNPAVQGAVAQTNVSVPAGGSVRVPIVFEPAALGAENGTVTFDLSGAPIGSGDIPPVVVRTVTVSGEGAAANLSFVVVQAGTPAPVSPGGVVDFGPTSVGSTNTLEFEVRNEGSTPG
ncbi:MAG: choice-of-anchor D domain-containing protein, partial [Bryobacterales bacterium]